MVPLAQLIKGCVGDAIAPLDGQLNDDGLQGVAAVTAAQTDMSIAARPNCTTSLQLAQLAPASNTHLLLQKAETPQVLQHSGDTTATAQQQRHCRSKVPPLDRPYCSKDGTATQGASC
jgi:hypothetical protein